MSAGELLRESQWLWRMRGAVPALPVEMLQTLACVAALGTVVCLGKSSVHWFSSQQCLEHYRRVRHAQLVRYNVCRRLEETIEACLFAKFD
jgi:hypothetical protein